jgi:hypothetical protein
MHWSTGALLGALSGVWAAIGLRGPRAHLAHTVVRLAFDQTVENGTGVGAPPPTWPWMEQAVDVSHKAVYSFATGFVAEHLIRPDLQPTRGTTSHRARTAVVSGGACVAHPTAGCGSPSATSGREATQGCRHRGGDEP